MARLTCRVEADGQTSRMLVDADSPESAAKRAIRSWRFDTYLSQADNGSGSDLDGPYFKYVFRVGHRCAVVRVYAPAQGGAK